ncbi:phospholipase [Micromonospora sp. NBC_01813]|uniref:phospholipase n=1 Tax=Micromonospora sp. NBC_01813 TaxID=2975988 RepID=UPI002DDABD29|nr:phospholipase [Micromonospora sp. NBC_01813]WSA06447.1 phospholipase [Micromonospora sp. NBC_01813]
MHRRLTTLLTATLLGLTGALGSAGPAAAVPADKPAVLSSFTQTTASSYNAWNSARLNQGSWAAYQFDWSTDYCSSSPDNPLGFSFQLSCQRHDFGYRNYRAAGQFSANKARVDNAFYEDLKRVCATYNSVVRPACLSLAWTYYQAVKIFGAPEVDSADLERAAQLMAAGPQLVGTTE